MHREPTLQNAWNAHGEAAFEYEIVEKLDEDVHPLEIDDRLKAAKKSWIERLKARPLL
ncbi:MAG: hypothetical protein P4L03_09740 [Terracidiphilus sp.]|nr:hypothetical protein [Terracidiphilus sp.]